MAPMTLPNLKLEWFALLALLLTLACLSVAREGFAQLPEDDGSAAGEVAEAPSSAAAETGEVAETPSSAAAEAGEPAELEVSSEVLLDLPDLPDVLDPDNARPAPVTRFETLIELTRLAAADQYLDALPLTEQLVDMTEAEFGEHSYETAEAYRTAARVQRAAGEYQLAEENLLHAVRVLRELDGPYTERAIDPLIDLGDSYHAAGEYMNAVTVYDEARSVHRRVFGLLNEDQIPILDKISESYIRLDQRTEADRQQLEILRLAERNHPEASPEHLEALYRYAGWLRESKRYTNERTRYQQTINLIRNHYGKESPLLIRSLREIGNSFRAQGLPSNQGISSLREALELAEAQEPLDPLAVAEVLRDLGDWDVAFSRIEPNLEAYETAWLLLGEVENGVALREEWFSGAQRVFEEPVSQRYLSNEPNAPRGFVVVRFDVDSFGRPRRVAVARSDPPGLKDEAFVRAVRSFRFRPFIEDGEITPRSGVAVQFNYRYQPSLQEQSN